MADDKHCDGCPLQGVSTPVPLRALHRVQFLVVTDVPSKFNAEAGRLLPANSSKLLGNAMAEVGLHRDDFAFHPQVRCPYDQDTYTTKQKREIQQHCRGYYLDAVDATQPAGIIPLGAEASRQVFGRAVKITKVRGVMATSAEHGIPVLPMLSPSMVSMYPQHLPTMQSDARTLHTLANSGFNLSVVSRAKLGEYEFIDDLQFLIDAEPKVLFLDTENVGLEYFKEGTHEARDYNPAIHGKEFDPSAAVLSIQFCIEPGVAYMLLWDHPDAPMSDRKKQKVRRQLDQLLNNPKTVVAGQNLKYDCVYLAAKTGVRFRIGGDTLMLATLLDENASSKGQDMLVRRYVPEMAGYADEFNAKCDKSRMWEVPSEELLDYGCGDADSGFRLYETLLAEVRKDKRLYAHYKHVSLPGLNAFASMELRGLFVNEDALDELEEVISEVVGEQLASLLSQVPRSIKRAHVDKGIKFSRPDFTRDILFTHKDGFRLRPKVFTKTTAKLEGPLRVPSISSKEHLPYFYEECPFTVELTEYVKNERLLNTNIRGFKKKYIHGGMVRPRYSLTTAVTGRTASENPNGQNIPKRGKMAKAYRKVFVAPEGFYLLEADLSQAELRISADMANETTMLAIYGKNGDIHRATALIVMGVTAEQFARLPKEEQDLARFKAKAVNFGFIYGMGWRKFIGYAKTQYGVEFTEKEAQRIRNEFFARYSRLKAWHERQREMAVEHGQVRSYSGRIRHLPMITSDDELVRSEAGRQAINSPVQEFGSSLGVATLGRIDAEIDEKYLAPVAFVHDAIYCYVRKEYLDWGARTLKWYMESNPIEEWFGIRMKCPILADVGFGENMGETHELPGLKIDEPYDYSTLYNEEEGSGILVPRQRFPKNDGMRRT